MKCPECQFDNPDTQKFCGECGSKLEKVCSNCGNSNPAPYKFCGECGHNLTLPSKLAQKELSFDEKLNKIQRYLPKGLTEKIIAQKDRIEGEHKQVTVMFCDMEGFTHLSEKLGPEEAYNIMDKIYEILIHKVHDYEGTVNEMTGDGIMALFGAPLAIEDAPQRAIRSAYSIHRETVRFSEKIRQEQGDIPPIRMRIGIHTGPVVVGTLGNDLRVEFKAVGDTVNLASRIEGLAEPGTTFVTEETFKLTEGLFRFESIGEKEVKGKEEPVKVYQVIAPSTMKTMFAVSAEKGLTHFVGREKELELLLDGFDRCKSGRGQAFSIMAEAGVGKSRLLYEFRKAISNQDFTFLEGKCLSYSRGIAYHPIIGILKSNFDIFDDDRDNTIREKVISGLKILEADDDSTHPYLLELLFAKNGGIDKKALGPEMIKVRIMEALNRVVLKGSQIQPLIIAVEDLHWIDRSSEEYLKNLLDYISGARVLLIFTYRPEFVHIWGGKSYHSQVNLNRLSNRESLAMVTKLLGADEINKELEELIINKTEGVPFFIEEFVKSLKDLGIIEKDNNTYYIAKDAEFVTIPARIQDVIMARVDTLPDGAKRLLQTGAVIGRQFSHELIRRVMDLPEGELMSHLLVLKDSELLYESGIYPESSYIFKHALTQEVSYNSLLEKQKKEVHWKIGSVIEALYPEHIEINYEVLAFHYGRSANKDKALEYLDRANSKAYQISAMEEAKAYFYEIMNLLDTLPDTKENKERRISLLVKQSWVFTLLFTKTEYYDLLTRYKAMAVKIENQEILGGFYVRLGTCEGWHGKLDKSIQTLTKAIELCEASGNIVDERYAYSNLIESYLYLGDFDRVLTVGEKALKISDSAFDPYSYVHTVTLISWAYSYIGCWDRAVEECQKTLSIAEKLSNNSLISFASFSIIYSYIQKGDLPRPVEYGELAIEKAPTPGESVFSQAPLGWALCRVGEASKGLDLLTQSLHMIQAAGYLPFEVEVRVMLGEGYRLAEEFERSRQTLEEALDLAEHLKMKYFIGWSNRILGEIAIITNLNRAAAHFDKSVNICKKIGAENELALAFAGYGRLNKHQGNIAEARGYFEKALEIFERFGTLIEPEKIRKELAELPEA